MPYVNIKVTKENGEPTIAQKEELIKGVTELLHNVLGRNKTSTVVIIDEIETENYGLGGESIKVKRQMKG
ncbi:Putative isomerase [Campylobacter hyointestinalis]|uniref:2-hydroxymuconate tautomerase family protein n=1 Tax=Campylobacter hyointestinalis TaxID=198 RepID=UPI000724CCEC|nr:4-oxalocrotonate tautomerase family protein [Campylobacter hyointestinalis]PPB56756.1 tautomerase [Campylobacter hyointestinalis subsp. hyointestinalis]CUU72598.1 Putative isomerase [Campylobacter hyointestinalis]